MGKGDGQHKQKLESSNICNSIFLALKMEGGDMNLEIQVAFRNWKRQ